MPKPRHTPLEKAMADAEVDYAPNAPLSPDQPTVSSPIHFDENITLKELKVLLRPMGITQITLSIS
jgi:hypothetical protein